jgi:hypothetical protein
VIMEGLITGYWLSVTLAQHHFALELDVGACSVGRWYSGSFHIEPREVRKRYESDILRSLAARVVPRIGTAEDISEAATVDCSSLAMACSDMASGKVSGLVWARKK